MAATMPLYKGRLETTDGEALYPHTSTDVVFNSNGNSVDEILQGQEIEIQKGSLQIGDVLFTGRTIEDGHWLPCNGQYVLRNDYPELYNAISDGYSISTDLKIVSGTSYESPYGYVYDDGTVLRWNYRTPIYKIENNGNQLIDISLSGAEMYSACNGVIFAQADSTTANYRIAYSTDKGATWQKSNRINCKYTDYGDEISGIFYNAKQQKYFGIVGKNGYTVTVNYFIESTDLVNWSYNDSKTITTTGMNTIGGINYIAMDENDNDRICLCCKYGVVMTDNFFEDYYRYEAQYSNTRYVFCYKGKFYGGRQKGILLEYYIDGGQVKTRESHITGYLNALTGNKAPVVNGLVGVVNLAGNSIDFYDEISLVTSSPISLSSSIPNTNYMTLVYVNNNFYLYASNMELYRTEINESEETFRIPNVAKKVDSPNAYIKAK